MTAGDTRRSGTGPDLIAGSGTAALFDRLAGRYDAWYDGPAGAALFPAETGCLRSLLAGLPRQWIEVGAGSGRFAAALGADIGLDPAAGCCRWPARAVSGSSAATADGSRSATARSERC